MTKKGFTLAEVLITLTIIGVVASLTIPSLINNIGDQQNKIAWKKAYADLSNAAQKVVFDNGGTIKGVFASHDPLANAFANQFNVIKYCDGTNSLGNCWHNADDVKYLSNSIRTFTAHPSMVLGNGTLIYFNHESTSCTSMQGAIAECAYIFIDINGFKAPNTIGRDVFRVHLTENGIKPYGVTGDADENTCKATSNGYGCSSEYLYN